MGDPSKIAKTRDGQILSTGQAIQEEGKAHDKRVQKKEKNHIFKRKEESTLPSRQRSGKREIVSYSHTG